ncbi:MULTISPECIES: hypothetical protein [Streptomyces]|uniref:DUF5302 domain-containing protein n=1 Tax=Streptomyces silvisoli TaxID=3034235 RepID=A0ABT5ZFL3_9ACTN|nr:MULTISPECIES: hypothetical protein [Streptomyces]MDF3288622.1 hypothetical protein [Streptomyces silvisoli]
MAKNKDTKKPARQPESSRSAAERSAEDAKNVSLEAHRDDLTAMSMARKGRQKRFGHN